jgi:hypothetical protein
MIAAPINVLYIGRIFNSGYARTRIKNGSRKPCFGKNELTDNPGKKSGLSNGLRGIYE